MDEQHTEEVKNEEMDDDEDDEEEEEEDDEEEEESETENLKKILPMEDEINEDELLYEPQVTSSDPEERKLARRLRIKRRIAAIKKKHEMENAEPVIVKSLLENQIEASAAILEQILLEGDETVSNVRAGNDAREVTRRGKEAVKRAEILEALETEARDAEELYEEIYSKWEKISKYKDPLDISDSIDMQKEQCNELINQKDEIIKMLRDEINAAEQKYVADQDVQEDDISTLVDRIDSQINLMRKAYRSELDLIEVAIAKERENLMEEKNKKWQELQEQRSEEEDINMQTQLAMADEFMETFYNTRVKYEEKYRALKIELERQGEVLEQELEKLKAACLLSGEKLDYNYNILKKREDENLLIRSQQKRMLNKLQDGINNIRRNMREYKIKAEATISKLTFEIKKTRNLIFEIEKKAEHICMVNNRRFKEIWDLNEKAVNKELERILQTDRVIHEQLLGLEWKSPLKNLIKMDHLSSYKEAQEILAAEETKHVKTQPTYQDFEKYSPSILRDVLEKISFRSGFLLETKLVDILPKLPVNEQNLIQIDNVFDALGIKKEEDFRYMIDFFLPFAHCPICDQGEMNKRSQMDSSKSLTFGIQTSASSLENETAKDSIVAGEEDHQTNMNDLRKQIEELPGVVTKIVTAELEELTEKGADEFSAGSSVLSSSISESEVSSDEYLATTDKIGPRSVSVNAICKFNHPLKIENVNVYKILKDFVSAFNFSANEVITLQNRIQRKYNSLSRLMLDSDIKMFWEQYCNVFTSYHAELWTEIFYGLKRYHAILIDRQKVYDQVVNLRKENFELRHMLKNCAFNTKKETAKKKKSFKYRVVKIPSNLLSK